MEGNAEAIVGLAWARVLGLPDDALIEPAGGLITHASDEMIMFVRLWQHEVLVGPTGVLDHVRASGGAESVDEPQLLAQSFSALNFAAPSVSVIVPVHTCGLPGSLVRS